MACEIPAHGMDLSRSLRCAQAFRWEREHERERQPTQAAAWVGSEKKAIWFGVAGGKALEIEQRGDVLLLFCPPDDIIFWSDYFSLGSDYGEMERLLAQDPVTSPCLGVSRGIRIFRQEPFETLISFILSANNNFGRICGIVRRLCEHFGQPFHDVHIKDVSRQMGYAFPTPESLAGACEEQLKSLGAGYRAAFVQKAAQRVADGYDLEALRALPFAMAQKELESFAGVGPKVAQCVMLFSLGFEEAYPVDVWVGRASQMLYPELDGKEAAARAAQRFGRWAGAAQQYLFHYVRTMGLKQPDDIAEKMGESV